ncbi:MAG TPA: 2-phospho-L-lactate guanylyltransferase [Acidimicrobiia bacterium]|nr:2-phospho-L-lactate guanylyltransferase [Acidimicrobiia bacterium]
MSHSAVVIPIRSFGDGKSRLGARLDRAERAGLVRSMAENVVAAAGPMPVAVVSGAPEVREWALALGLSVLDDPGSLDRAAAAGLAWAAAGGFGRVVIAHGDLPLATALSPLTIDRGRPVAVIVPCHRDDGTPVLSLPTAADGFAFAYGPGSFRRHAAAARAAGLAVRVRRDDRLGRDVDAPEDLVGLPGPARLPAPLGA